MKETRDERRKRFELEAKQKKEKQELMNRCKASIRNDITIMGYRPVLLQYEYLKATPSLKTRFNDLSRSEVLECYEYVFENHKSK